MKELQLGSDQSQQKIVVWKRFPELLYEAFVRDSASMSLTASTAKSVNACNSIETNDESVNTCISLRLLLNQ